MKKNKATLLQNFEQIALVIVTYRRQHLLQRLLNSIPQKVKKEVCILIGINGDDPETYNFLKSLPEDNRPKVTTYSSTTPSKIRNSLVRSHPNAQYYLFVDDDCYFPAEYFDRALKILRSTSYDLFGGPDQGAITSTLNTFQKVYNQVLTSPFAYGPARYRHSHLKSHERPGSEKNLILCNLWISRTVFWEKKIWFPEQFFRNEENVFIKRALALLLTAHWFPTLTIYHERKNSIYPLALSTFRSGYFRGVMSRRKELRDWTFFAPLILTIAAPIIGIKAFSLLYTLIVTFFFFTTPLRKSYFFLYFIQHFIVHLSYSLGMLYSFTPWPKRGIYGKA